MIMDAAKAKIKIFSTSSSYEEPEQAAMEMTIAVNKWLEKNDDCKIIDKQTVITGYGDTEEGYFLTVTIWYINK